MHSAFSKYSTSQIDKVLEKLGYTMYVKHFTKPNGSQSSKKVRKLPCKTRKVYGYNRFSGNYELV